MKRFVVLVAMLCVVMIASTVSAKDVPLYDGNVSTLIQKLQEIPDVKIWDMEKMNVNGVSGYSGYFGDNKKNKLTFLVNDDDSIKALGIESQFGNNDPALEQILKIACGTLVMAGVTVDDVAKLIQDMMSDMEKALRDDSNLKEYDKSFFAYRAQDRREFVVNFSLKEINHDEGEFKITIFAHE